MDFNIDIRRIQLESLDQFIASSKEKVQGVLEALEWDSEAVLKDNKFITCSLDTNHKVPQKSADCHIRWNGQDPDPKTDERLITTYSADERLALYDYAVGQTHGPEALPEYDVTQQKRDETKPLTYEDQLALERDAKRRRLKYKSVHTSRKSHTEVLREVIETQMGLYKEWLTEKPDEKPPRIPKEPEERSISRNSSTSSKSKKEIKRELSDTESIPGSRRNSVESADKSRLNNHGDREYRRRSSSDYRTRYREEVRDRFDVRRDNYRRRERSRDRSEFRHERRRSKSRERRRSRDRRNGSKDYRS